MTILHKYHIVPKHAGGTDDLNNLILLTVEEHAEAHRVLYEQYGRWQDKLAWNTLSGHISRAEAIKMAQKNADKSYFKTAEWREQVSKRKKGKPAWNKGLSLKDDPNNEGLRKLSEIAKRQMAEGRLHCIGDKVRGVKKTPAQNEAIRQRKANEQYRTCPHCNTKAKPAMYGRWHGDRCRKLLTLT